MVKINPFEVSVLVDGKAVKEILDPEADIAAELKRNRITTYVEVEEGTEFTVKCWTKSNFKFGDADCISWSVYIDGIWRCGMLTTKEDHKKPGPTITNISSCYIQTEEGTKDVNFSFGKTPLSS